jgi:hypothetical protein
VSSLPDKPENITFSRALTIVEPDNKLVILGSVAGVLVTSVLLMALYAPHSRASLAPRRRRRTLPACTPLLSCSYVLMKHGTTKAKAIVVAVLKGEVKTAWGLVIEAFDFAGDTAIFVAIQEDAQNPIYKARVAAIIMPVRADDSPACSHARI